MELDLGFVLAVTGALLAIALPGIGSIIGTKLSGSAASGVISEKPELFGKALLLVALTSSQAIYGFLTSILIMQKVGLVGAELLAVSPTAGWALLLASLPAAVTAMFSGVAQGQIATGGMGVIAKHADASGKAIILAALVETFAIFGLLASILLIQGIAL